jgi:glucose/arabinose dehydrogenase
MNRPWRIVVAALLVAGATPFAQNGPVAPAVAAAATPTVDIAGLARANFLDFTTLPPNSTPVGFRFAPGGRIYVAIKEGRVLMYDGIGNTTPVTTLDISTQVHTFVDRGLLGIALDPAFATTRPYLYVLYTYNRDPFGANTTVPRWAQVCPYPPGGGTDGCPVTARLERYTVGANGIADPTSRVLLLDGADNPLGGWCEQFQSHSIGTVEFGPDGMVYVGAGDGAWYGGTDFGQKGGTLPNPAMPVTPANPCNDNQTTADHAVHTGGRGAPLAPGPSRGGALRSQSVRNALPNEYVTWDGSILRLDPNTGAPAAGNPLIGNGIAGDAPIVAYGLRNPFRFTFRPGTNDLWIGDVGYNTYEEIDTTTIGLPSVPNFGWPCYEGPSKQGSYNATNIDLCASLYATPTSSLGGVTSPLVGPKYTWARFSNPGPDAPALPCGTTSGGGASVGGSFVSSPNWPTTLRGAYVFGDYARGCLMAMPLDTNGVPDATKVTSLVSGIAPVDIKTGPDGNVYWIDIVTKKLDFLGVGPDASFTATPSFGAALPLHVSFDASATTDPNVGQTLTYRWDLNGDGVCDDAIGVVVSSDYSVSANVPVKLCVEDGLHLTGSTTRIIYPGDTPPIIQSVVTSADGTGWKIGNTVDYTAVAVDNEEALPVSAYVWGAVIEHCDAVNGPSCHTHPLQSLPSGPTGSFVTPDHEFYAYVALTLTVTDSRGMTAVRSVNVLPRLSDVTVQTNPAGLVVSSGGRTGTSPFAQQFLEGGSVQMIAPPTATHNGRSYTFAGWADAAGAQNLRDLTAQAGSTTYTADYTLDNTPPTIQSLTTSADATGFLAGDTINYAASAVDAEDGVLPSTAYALNLIVQQCASPDRSTCTAKVLQALSPPTAGSFIAPALGPYSYLQLALTVTDGDGQSTSRTADLQPRSSSNRITPIVPLRLLDTRNGTGAPAGRVAARQTTRIQVTGVPGVPVGATAVVLNATTVGPDAGGYVTVFPCGNVPTVSNLNASAGDTVANLATVALDAQGGVCLTSQQSTDLVADLSAVVIPGYGDGYTATTPQRVIDTRVGLGAGQRRIEPNEVLTVPLESAGVPAGASAVVANITVTNPEAAGYLTAFPCDSAPPVASNLNYGARQTVSNLVLTSLGGGHQLCLVASQRTDVVVDVSGWLGAAGASVVLRAPTRVVDTRDGGGRLNAGQTVRLDTRTTGAPAGATAMIINITAVDTSKDGFVTVYPCSVPRPLASNVNHGANENRPVLAVAGIGTDGAVCIYASTPIDLVVDLQGWLVTEP